MKKKKNLLKVSGTAALAQNSLYSAVSNAKEITDNKVITLRGSGAMAATSMRSELNQAMEHIRKGKFGKALEDMETAPVMEVLTSFVDIKDPKETIDIVKEEINDLIRIAKSFYEYDPKERRIMDDASYDQILAIWRAYGLEEPTGIVPSEMNSKKTGIKYETLHNNMDKAYIINADDEIPAGVKETDSVEEFLTRSYLAMGLDPSERIRIAVSPKIDGVSVNGTVSGNNLITPQTRGDESASMAIIGLDNMQITDIDPEGQFGIQFEAFLTYQDLESVGAYLGKEYANNRNAVAGLINRLCTAEDPEILPYLSFYPIEAEGLNMRYLDRIDFLENFRIVPEDMISTDILVGDVTELLTEIKRTFDHYAEIRGTISFPIDGMVITIADDENQEILGRKGRTNLYQIALKFDPENAIGIVDHLELDCGRKGYRTPQIYLKEPVVIGGARYDHVPTLSASLFDQLGLRVGSVINIHRVGDVIPTITVIDEGPGEILELSGNCPVCGEEMVVKNKKLFCKNPHCENNQLGRMISLFNGIKLDGYSDSFVKELAEKSGRNVVVPGDLADINDDYMAEIGMTDKTSMKFPDRFAVAMKDAPDYVILGSMGIPDLGKARARQLLAYHGGFTAFLWRAHDDGLEALDLKNALGKIGQHIEDYFKEYPDVFDDFIRELKDLYDCGLITRLTENFEQSIRVGHTGGDLSEEVEELCEKLNMEIVDGSGFDILITASHDSTSGKMFRAKRKELPIYTQEEFLAEYSEEN